VFGIQTGVAISLLVRREKAQGCRIFYARRPELETAEEKLAFLSSGKLQALDVEEVRPDKNHNWINLTHNDFDTLIPVASKQAKGAKKPSQEKAIFKLFTLGIVTNRDEWVYGNDPAHIEQKVRFLIDAYNADVKKLSTVRDRSKLKDMVDTTIKWTRAVKNDLDKGIRYRFDTDAIVKSYYRPFVTRNVYYNRQLNEMLYQVPQIFGPKVDSNRAFCFAAEERSAFGVIAFENVPNKDIFMPSAAQVLAYYRFDDTGNRTDNITDWALDQFKKHYQPGRAKHNRPITKEAIFHYVYGVLHDPVYREKYAQNLKRGFPHIPLYADFWQWANWGKDLMDLHIGYEQVECFTLKRTDRPDEKSRKAGVAPKAMLKANKEAGCIVLDGETTLSGIPREAWTYTLGNRSALEWILDQYKEKKPKDPTIREKFDTYRFADFKEKVINLLMRVTSVSVRTVAIVNAMKRAHR
jgi:predicted helicase